MLARALTIATITLLCAAQGARAEAVIDGASAPGWQTLPQWVAQNMAEEYAVRDQDGALAFTATGAGKEMAWLLPLAGKGVSGDERYVLVRYRAEGFRADGGGYFLHGQEGTRGGRAYALANEVVSDGAWHTLAVDLLAVEPLEFTHNLVLKVIVGAAGEARVEIESIRFADTLPGDATVARVASAPTAPSTTPVPLSAEAFAPQTGWTQSPASEHSVAPAADGVRFAVRGPAAGMRWLMSLAEPVDTAAQPWLSFRYRATGELDRSAYTLWLGQDPGGASGERMIAFPAGDVAADGAWHLVALKLAKTFAVSQVAVGLDAAGPEASLELADFGFSSGEPRWEVADVLPYEVRAGGWPAGQDGFTAAPVEVEGGHPSVFLARRMGLAGWFSAPEIAVGGVPFSVPAEIGALTATGTADFGELRLALPADVREVYLLTANTAPSTEPWGIDAARPRLQEMLDVPEKVVLELRYADGTPEDLVLPLDATSGRWGMKRGLGVCVARPDASRRATELVLREGMQTAAFAIVGATFSTNAPRIAEPDWSDLRYAAPPADPLSGATPATAATGEVCAGRLSASWRSDGGLTWGALTVPGLPGALAVAQGPVFEVTVGDEVLPSDAWEVVAAEPRDGGMVYRLRHAGAKLAATVELAAGAAEELLLRMELVNEGDALTVATLRFPVLDGVAIGSAEDTWYLAGKRGGIINRAPLNIREPLGERHPLQMDGFFGPTAGLALACLTHDTQAQHHFIRLARDERGGAWSCEYPRQDLAPGEPFAATEAALVLRAGDWRAIFAAYRDWLDSWFEPVAPRQEWFTNAFAVLATNVHPDTGKNPEQRGAIQPMVDTMLHYIGVCDWVNLFGWGASTQWGGWGDYADYDGVGGLDYFRGNIAAVQGQGIGVSLYLDGYLNSAQGRFSGEYAEDWAMLRADGSPQYIEVYDAYNECPYQAPWREYLSSTYARVERDLGARILYIDEYGSTDGRWTCYGREHGHNGYQIPYAGEVAMLEQIRAAVGPEVVLYTEYPPAEVSRRFLDGSITYQALWSADQQELAPHFIDLPRFAFPDFKQFHITYYVGTRAGNWWVNKFPFFNGEVYRVGEPNLPWMDEPSREFIRRAIRIQCDHRATFASEECTPLVPTEHPDLFANRFTGPGETIFTLYNAGGRELRGGPRGGLLRVPHVPGATYEDLWNARPIEPRIDGDEALLPVEIGPKSIGCVIQRVP